MAGSRPEAAVSANPFEGLCYLEAMPLQFRPTAGPPGAAELASLNADNVQVLLADASLDETHRGAEPADGDGLSAADLQRIEFKLNVLLQLVGTLLARAGDRPPPLPGRLFGHGLEFAAAGKGPAPGSRGVVSLYLSRGFPKPLELPGRVLGERHADGVVWTQFEFEGLTSQVTDLLVRQVFRHHRRDVALARSQT
jgi:Atypical PilZ domain, cyclic di-GMP receptor